jgi:hypothetical protein
VFDEALSYLSDALDKPGRAFRGLLGGNPDELAALVPFSDTMGLTDPSRRVSGANLAHDWFGLSPEDASGQAAGFGLEMALDPTNLIGLGAAGKAARVASRAVKTNEEAIASAKAVNALRESLLAKGAMPAEIAGQTFAKDAAGNPVKMYHGTKTAFEGPVDFARAGTADASTLGPGYYVTPDAELASSYAGPSSEQVDYMLKKAKPGLEAFGGSREAMDAAAEEANNTVNRLWHEHRVTTDDLRYLYENPKFVKTPHDSGYGYSSTIDPAHAEQEGLLDSRRRNLYYQIDDLRKKHDPEMRGSIAMKQLDDMLKNPAGVRTQYLDVRKPLDLRGTGYGEENLHPVLTKLQEGMGLPDPNRPYDILKERFSKPHPDAPYGTAEKYLAALKEHGYDSVIAPHEGSTGSQWVVFDQNQIYSPWIAPPEAPIPANVSAPSMARAAASRLGMLASYQTAREGFPNVR